MNLNEQIIILISFAIFDNFFLSFYMCICKLKMTFDIGIHSFNLVQDKENLLEIWLKKSISYWKNNNTILFRIDLNKCSLHIYNTTNWTIYWFCIYHFSILRFHVVNLIILFIARLMAISAPMVTINMRSRTTVYTAMARVAQKWLQLKKYWYYRFQSYCIRLQIKFRIRWSTLISDN